VHAATYISTNDEKSWKRELEVMVGIVGVSIEYLRHRSLSVDGLIAPSRWRWSSALGRRDRSRVFGFGIDMLSFY